MNSLLLTNNSSPTVLAADAVIPLGSAIHGFGRNIYLNGNEIDITGTGYYPVRANFTIAPTAATDVSVQMYLNGTAVSGAIASATPSAAAGLVNLSVDWVIRKSCCADAARVTFVVSEAATLNNATVEVTKA